jgi:hypothetical protein
MIKRKYVASLVCAILFLSTTLIPKLAHAASGNTNDDKPIYLHTAASEGPIGIITGSTLNRGALLINGQVARDKQMIWAGDLLQSSADVSVPVSIHSLGEVVLLKGSVVKFATSYTQSNIDSRAVLIASLICGSIRVALKEDACAYIEARGSRYVSNEGAIFDASVRDGKALINVKFGKVITERQESQHQYTIRPMGHGSSIEVPRGSLQQIKVQVTDNDQPVPDVAVLFTLDQLGVAIGQIGLGTLAGSRITIVTNADGIASVPFVAGNSKGTGAISATVEGTRTSWMGQLRVTSKSIGGSRSLWWTIAAIAGAGAAAGITYAVTRDKDSIQVKDPQVKNP